MESKDPKRARLDISAGDDTQSIPDSVPIMEATANQYRIGAQPSHSKPLRASQALPHSMAAFEPLEIPARGVSKESLRRRAGAPRANQENTEKIMGLSNNTRGGQSLRFFELTSTPVVTPHRYEAPCSRQLGI